MKRFNVAFLMGLVFASAHSFAEVYSFTSAQNVAFEATSAVRKNATITKLEANSVACQQETNFFGISIQSFNCTVGNDKINVKFFITSSSSYNARANEYEETFKLKASLSTQNESIVLSSWSGFTPTNVYDK